MDRKTYAYLVDCCRNLDRIDDALAACHEGLGLFPDDAELHFLLAGLLHQRGQLPEAVLEYQSLFALNGEAYLSSRNQDITGFVARQNLAAVYVDMNDLANA